MYSNFSGLTVLEFSSINWQLQNGFMPQKKTFKKILGCCEVKEGQRYDITATRRHSWAFVSC
jgi:hypothetical protein